MTWLAVHAAGLAWIGAAWLLMWAAFGRRNTNTDRTRTHEQDASR